MNNHFNFCCLLIPKHIILQGFTVKILNKWLQYILAKKIRFLFPCDIVGHFLFGKEGSPVASYTVQLLSI